jgi:hypothetical protein
LLAVDDAHAGRIATSESHRKVAREGRAAGMVVAVMADSR